MKSVLVRDEREASIDRAGDRLAYLAISYGLLLAVAYRSFVDHEASWDLLGLVLLGGIVGSAYRLWRGVWTRGAAMVLGVTLLVSVAVAVVVAMVVRA